MIEKTKAIPLAIYPYGNTSAVIQWLSPRFGKITTMLKGAYRPRSNFLGGFMPYETSELLFYYRPDAQMYTASECSLITEREKLHHSWRHQFVASYVCDIMRQVIPDFGEADEWFIFLERLLDWIQNATLTPLFIYWFELQVLDMLGTPPQLYHCGVCGKTLPDLAGPLRFSSYQGGLVEATCAEFREIPALPLSPNVLHLIQQLQPRERPPQGRLLLNEKEQAQIDELLAHFMAHHLSSNPRYRETILRPLHQI